MARLPSSPAREKNPRFSELQDNRLKRLTFNKHPRTWTLCSTSLVFGQTCLNMIYRPSSPRSRNQRIPAQTITATAQTISSRGQETCEVKKPAQTIIAEVLLRLDYSSLTGSSQTPDVPPRVHWMHAFNGSTGCTGCFCTVGWMVSGCFFHPPRKQWF